MNFGKSKAYTRKNKELSIPIGVDGVGSEQHPLAYKMISPTEEKILSIIKGKVKEPVIEGKPSKWKLYLNTIINLLYNKEKKDKPTRQSRISKIHSKLFKWWIKDTTDDMKDLVSFVFIHGLLGAPSIVSILTIVGLDIPLVTIIRNSITLSIIVYIIGSGSAYYLFLDTNKMLVETWSKKK